MAVVSDEKRIAEITAKMAEASGTRHPAFADMSYLLTVVHRLMAENTELRRMKPVAEAAIARHKNKGRYTSESRLDKAVSAYLAA